MGSWRSASLAPAVRHLLSLDDFATRAHSRQLQTQRITEASRIQETILVSGLPQSTELHRWGVDVCPMDLRSKDLLSGRGHQVLLIRGLPEVRFH